jgi:hypothetical protein
MTRTGNTEVGATAKPIAAKKSQAASKANKKPSKTDHIWMENYEMIKQYKRDYGHTYVSSKAPEDIDEDDWNDFSRHKQLAQWASRQRKAKKNGTLRKDREKLLEDIAFILNNNDVAWEQNYSKLVEIKEAAGHMDIPTKKDEITEENKEYKKMMAWAGEQKVQYLLRKLGYHNTLTDRRVQKLENIGFVWSRNEEDNARIHEKAKTKNLTYVLRKVTHLLVWNNTHMLWYMFSQLMKDAEKRWKETAEGQIPMSDDSFTGVEEDGTYVLIPKWDAEKMLDPKLRIVCYGSTKEELVAAVLHRAGRI